MKTEDLKRMLELVMAGHVASARDGEEDEGDMELRHLVCDYLEDVCRMALESLEPKGGDEEFLKSALAQYGQHMPTCYLNRGLGGCNCGYSRALGDTNMEEATAWRWVKAEPPQPSAREAALEEVAKLVVMLGSDDPRISDEDRLLSLRANSPLVGQAIEALRSHAPGKGADNA